MQLIVNTEEQQLDHDSLLICVDIISEAMTQVRQAGSALAEIKEGRYYRHWFGSFDRFVMNYWNISGSTAQSWINMARVAKVIELTKDIRLIEAVNSASATCIAKLPISTTDEEIIQAVKSTLASDTKLTQKSFKENLRGTIPETKLKEEIIDVVVEPTQTIEINYKELYEEAKRELKKQEGLKDRRNKEIKQLKSKLASVTNLSNIVESLYEVADAIAQMNFYKYAPKRPEHNFGKALAQLNIKELPKDTKEAIKLVKKSYKDLAKIYHPDKGGNTDSFNEIRKAMQQIIKELNYE